MEKNLFTCKGYNNTLLKEALHVKINFQIW